MSPRGSEAGRLTDKPKAVPESGQALECLVLARIASAGGATRNMVTRDLAPYVSNKLSPAEWRRTAEVAIFSLAEAGALKETRGRLHASLKGQQKIAEFLGQDLGQETPWQVQRDVVLVAKALGLVGLTAQQRKALSKPDGLRSLIVQQSFGLATKKNQSLAILRGQLAVIALERAFGKKIKTGLGPKANLPAKTSRLLAGQLLDPAREFSTDTQLIAHLAADQVDARQTSLEELRLALIRGLTLTLLDDGTQNRRVKLPVAKTPSAKRKPTPPKLEAANDTKPTALHEGVDPRPNLRQFARIVNAIAASCAEGWPGNLKAFISHVWHMIRDGHPNWNLSEVEFKSMLIDAHRAGLIVLSGADLKNKNNLEDFKNSAIAYKNTVWHFIRVES